MYTIMNIGFYLTDSVLSVHKFTVNQVRRVELTIEREPDVSGAIGKVV